MDKMKLLVTMPDGYVKEKFLCENTRKLLEEKFEVIYNDLGRAYTKEELEELIDKVNIIITGWGTPTLIGSEALKANTSLKMIAHTAGSVGDLLDDTVYEKGIAVVSGNRFFAQSVAEGTIAYIMSVLRNIPDEVYGMKKEGAWKKNGVLESRGILGREIGIIGYGMISRHLMRMLKPFGVKIKIFSQFPMDMDFLDDVNAEPASVEEIFSTCSIVSLHSSLNEKTIGMIKKEHFEMMQEDAVFINTARGAIVNQEEMIDVLSHKNIRAFLDVYAVEPLEADSPLRKMNNVYLMPHKAGPTTDMLTFIGGEVAKDVIRFADNKPLKCEIDRAYAARMTKQHIAK